MAGADDRGGRRRLRRPGPAWSLRRAARRPPEPAAAQPSTGLRFSLPDRTARGHPRLLPEHGVRRPQPERGRPRLVLESVPELRSAVLRPHRRRPALPPVSRLVPDRRSVGALGPSLHPPRRGRRLGLPALPRARSRQDGRAVWRTHLRARQRHHGDRRVAAARERLVRLAAGGDAVLRARAAKPDGAQHDRARPGARARAARRLSADGLLHLPADRAARAVGAPDPSWRTAESGAAGGRTGARPGAARGGAPAHPRSRGRAALGARWCAQPERHRARRGPRLAGLPPGPRSTRQRLSAVRAAPVPARGRRAAGAGHTPPWALLRGRRSPLLRARPRTDDAAPPLVSPAAARRAVPLAAALHVAHEFLSCGGGGARGGRPTVRRGCGGAALVARTRGGDGRRPRRVPRRGGRRAAYSRGGAGARGPRRVPHAGTRTGAAPGGRRHPGRRRAAQPDRRAAPRLAVAPHQRRRGLRLRPRLRRRGLLLRPPLHSTPRPHDGAGPRLLHLRPPIQLGLRADTEDSFAVRSADLLRLRPPGGAAVCGVPRDDAYGCSTALPRT